VFNRAIVRIPGANFAQGLTAARLGAPRYDGVLQQHALYCEALRTCGLTLTTLDGDPDHPDSTFVEDTAVLTLPKWLRLAQ
jgi:dimethylargininase